jgi:hypothetical protein
MRNNPGFGVREDVAILMLTLAAGLSAMATASVQGWTAGPSLGLVLVTLALAGFARLIRLRRAS